MYNKRLGIIGVIATLALVAITLVPVQHAQASSVAIAPYADSFAEYGMPSAPAMWQPSNWDVQTHVRDGYAGAGNDTHLADHGSDCGAPPAQHSVSTWQQAVFVCHSHVMTAIANGGYGEVALTPDHMADWSGGQTTVSFSLSTAVTTARDWFSLTISPFAEQQSLMFDFGEADLEGMPLHYVNVRTDLSANNQLRWRVVQEGSDDFGNTVGDTNAGLPDMTGIPPSASARTPFEFTFDANSYSLKIGAASPIAAGRVLLSGKFAHALTFSRGIVQFIHHSYDPNKCDVLHVSCTPDTWHLSDIGISSAVAYTLMRPTDHQVVSSSSAVSFASPAPSGAFLKFAGIGTVQVSMDGGHTYAAAKRAPADPQYSGHDEHFHNFMTPIPAGVSQIFIKVAGGWFGPGYARDFSLISQTLGGSPPPTVTPVPPTFTPVPPTPTVPPMGTPTPTSTPACTP